MNEKWPSVAVLLSLEPRLGEFYGYAALDAQARALSAQLNERLESRPELSKAYDACNLVNIARAFAARLLLAGRLNKLEEIESR
jgi:hypothetical protein